MSGSWCVLGPFLSLSRVVGKWEGMLGIVPAREK